MWRWFALLSSAVFAAPNFLSSNEGRLSASKRPVRALCHALRWLNPWSWLSLTSKEAQVATPAGQPTTFLDAIQLAEFYGYTAESHSVTTEDGYILELHRLPSGRREGISDTATQDEVVDRPVILLHHAFVTSSRDFLILGPQKAIGFVLADAGYDVWLCNARGNSYSRRHVSLSPKEEKFWDFSYHEYGYYDLPAVIDYALKVSGKSKLHYFGFSVGTVAFFILSSERPEVLDKVTSFTAMGPLMTTANARSRFVQLVLRVTPFGMAAMRRLGIYEFLPHYRFFTILGQTIYNNCRLSLSFTMAFFNILSGTTALMKPSILPELLAHTPSGTSIKTMEHFVQNSKTGFRKFDFGPEENMKRYNAKTPPLYNVQAVRVPTQIVYAMNDMMADFTEGQKLCKLIPEVFNCEGVSDKRFTHLDFIYAESAYEIVYSRLLDGLRRFDVCSTQAQNSLAVNSDSP